MASGVFSSEHQGTPASVACRRVPTVLNFTNEPMTRYAKRVDENHAEVVAGIRHALPEATVMDLSGPGQGCPDIMVGYAGRNYLLEIKDGAKAPSRRDLTDAQKTFHGKWQGQAAVVTTAAEALAAILRAQTR